MRYRFSLHNRDSLRAERELALLARHLSEAVTTSSTIRRLSHETDPPKEGWIIFAGEDGQGFGIRPEYESASYSSLQRALENGGEGVLRSKRLSFHLLPEHLAPRLMACV
jgi:hypothetical protein